MDLLIWINIFYGGGAAYLLSWIGMANAGWLGSMRSEIFFQMKFTIFQSCSTKEDAFLSGQATPCNQLLTPSFCLFQNTILHKMLKLGFWNFKPFFSQNADFIGYSIFFFFFSLVLVICLSWYLHVKLSYEFYLIFWTPNGLSITFKSLLSDWIGPKYKCKVSSYMDNTRVLLRNRLNLGFSLNYLSFLFKILCI